jgi:hypothetical protein
MNREVDADVKKSGFSKVEVVRFKCPIKIFNLFNVCPVLYAVYGWAIK